MALDIAQHKNILIKILKDVYVNTDIGPLLGLKGGTAAYLFYELSRASFDLDFDLLDEAREDDIFERMEAIARQYGNIKESKKKRYDLFILLSYKDDAPNIKININRGELGSRYEVKSYLGIAMSVMVREDMFAHTLVAMYERIGATHRDVFDVYFFLQNNWDINRDIVEKRTMMPFREFLRRCIKLLEKMDDKNILFGMGELLDEKQKAWAREKLKDETIFLLKLKLETET